jgi:DNA modification methylase
MIATGPGWELRLGDCIEGMRGLADGSVDVVITDPPYSQHTHDKQWLAYALSDGKARVPSPKSASGGVVASQHKGLNFAHLTEGQAAECAYWFGRLARRWVIAFTDIEGVDLWRRAVQSGGLDYVRTCIWDKVDGAPQFTGDRPAAGAEAFVVAHRPGKKSWNGGGRRNVFRHEVNAVNGGPAHKPHPTTKPLRLMRELVELFSDQDELILDPFAGSGSTGIAATQLNRRFLGFELNRDSFDIACRRLRGEEAKPNPAQPSLFGAL